MCSGNSQVKCQYCWEEVYFLVETVIGSQACMICAFKIEDDIRYGLERIFNETPES